MLAFFIVVNTVSSLFDLDSCHGNIIRSVFYLDRHVLGGEAADKAAYQAHLEGLRILAAILLASSLCLWTRVIPAERAGDVVPVLEAHPMECMAAENSELEVFRPMLTDLCHQFRLSLYAALFHALFRVIRL